MEEVHINWSTFLLNEFLEYFLEMQEKGTTFHYTWLLVCIALVGWKELEGSQFFDRNIKSFKATRYTNLWFNFHNFRKTEGQQHKFIFVW